MKTANDQQLKQLQPFVGNPRKQMPFIVLLEMKKLNTQEPEALLAKVPTHLRGISCVCNACISRYLQQKSLNHSAE
ncbi:MAG: hypothetical protein JKX67_06005 [Colwellia sp.]|nr:hypothetical protein [Colwellia sp.]